ncbi:MAG: transcription elongation factor GreA [Anaerolineae bacterium]|nr:transcription elongation factor GreA [Anaerolineae bacterium]
MMVEDVNYLTPEGKIELEQELHRLKEYDRPALAAKLKEAVAMGDLKENADYHDTREKMSLMDGKILRLETVLRDAIVVENDGTSDMVRIGSKVTIREVGEDEDEVFMIVGQAEANSLEGKISSKSPIGAGLLNRKKGDKIKVETPNGTITLKIKKIK